MTIFTHPLFWLLLMDIVEVVAVILALYILVLNLRQLANRVGSLALSLIILTIFGASGMLRASSGYDDSIPGVLLGAAFPAISPALIWTVLAIFKPAWLVNKMRWIQWVFGILIIIPGLLALFDLFIQPNLYLSPQLYQVYRDGLLLYKQVEISAIGQFVIYFYLMIFPALLGIILGYLALAENKSKRLDRSLLLYLLVVQILIVVSVFLAGYIPLGTFPLLIGFLYLIGYGVILYRRLVASGNVQAGKLRNRMVLLMLAIAIPSLVFLSSSLTRYAGDQVKLDANRVLQGSAEHIQTMVDAWLRENVQIVRTIATLPDIVSLDATKQKPFLELYAENHPYLSLITTIDMTGMIVARSGSGDLGDYKDERWFKLASSGVPQAIQSLIDPTTGESVIAISVPIFRTPEEIIGVIMVYRSLEDLHTQVLSFKLGETGYAYLVDDANRLLIHRDHKTESDQLADFSENTAIQSARSNVTPPFIYQDNQGISWRSYSKVLDNGWLVVVQQEEAELLLPYRSLQVLAGLLVGSGIVILISWIFVTLRRATQPITSLTETIQAVVAGDLERVAQVESEDEIGNLAQAFNSMTAQMRESISDLETRIAQRTLELERRSTQLQAASEVGHAAATIRNLDELLPLVSRLISERFGFYHVGIFLLDDKQEYALLRATNSAGGQRMLERGHKLRVGQQGIVGYVTATREPRIALNVGEDAVFFNNLDLPYTQSEMALPLIVGDELLGALDVQSDRPNAFSGQDVETLQVLADQVAIAINSVQLLQQSIELLESERQLFGEEGRRTWGDHVGTMTNIGYLRERSGVYPLSSITDPKVEALLRSGQVVVDQDDPSILYVPVIVRGLVIGMLRLEHEKESGGWSKDEIDLMKSFAEQLGIALESARSYQQTQLGAQRDRTLSDIGARIRETLDIPTILRTATQEVRQVLNLPKVIIRMGTPPQIDGDGNENPTGGQDG